MNTTKHNAKRERKAHKASTKISKTHGEYRVRLFIDGEYQAGKDYFTNDAEEAREIAKLMEAASKPSLTTQPSRRRTTVDLDERCVKCGLRRFGNICETCLLGS